MTLLTINRLLPIYISIVPLKFEVDIQSQNKVKSPETKKSNMAARRPFWKWHRWKSIGFCLWPPSTCIWNLKLKFLKQTWLMLRKPCHLQRDGQTDKVNPVYPPTPTSLGGDIIIQIVCNRSTMTAVKSGSLEKFTGDQMARKLIIYKSRRIGKYCCS